MFYALRFVIWLSMPFFVISGMTPAASFGLGFLPHTLRVECRICVRLPSTGFSLDTAYGVFRPLFWGSEFSEMTLEPPLLRI